MATAKAETVVETVSMDDGRKVDFAGKRKLQKEQVGADDDMTVRFDFRNGETRTLVIDPAMAYKFAIHGAMQKFGDEIAGVEDLDDAILAFDDLLERIGKGEWNVKREANGMAGTSVLLKALVEATGQTVEKVKTFLSAKTHQEKLALRNSAKVKPIVERIEAEKASKSTSKVDTEALLGELSA